MHRFALTAPDSTFLKPGEFWFGKGPARVHTILGSCIAITLWHPQRHLGGMCHYLLPDVEVRRTPSGLGRTAGEAMGLILASLRRHGTRPEEYQVKVFGGASFYSGANQQRLAGLVAARNVIAARALLKQEGFQVLREHVGGQASRKLILDLANGDTWLQLTSCF